MFLKNSEIQKGRAEYQAIFKTAQDAAKKYFMSAQQENRDNVKQYIFTQFVDQAEGTEDFMKIVESVTDFYGNTLQEIMKKDAIAKFYKATEDLTVSNGNTEQANH